MTTKKAAKHPKRMTTEEAITHLFHPKVVAHAKAQAAEGKGSKKRVIKK